MVFSQAEPVYEAQMKNSIVDLHYTVQKTIVRDKTSYLFSLDVLRVVATLLVLCYHVHSISSPITGQMPFGGLFQSGSSRGIDIFFVLSGFVILWTHEKDVGQPAKWASYLSRRLLRIYPAAIIMTLVAIILYEEGFGGLEKASKLEPHNLMLSLMLMAERSSAVLNVAWTLKYLVFSYFLFSIAILDATMGVVAILTWQTGIIAHVYANIGGSGWDTYFLQPMGLEFGMGMACALMVRRLERLLSPHAAGVLLVVGILGFAVGKLTESYTLHRDLPDYLEIWVFGICTGSIIVGLSVLDLRGSIAVPRIFTVLGAASFSVYLVNYSSIVLAMKAIQFAGFRAAGNLVALGLAGVGILLWLFLLYVY